MTEEIIQQTTVGTKHLLSFVEAEINFDFTEQQQSTFSTVEQALVSLTNEINNDKLHIDIGKTSDDEIFISRKSVNGVSNLLIYEDGTMAHSFVPYKGSNQQDFLHFFEPVETINHEQLLLQFFSY